MRKGVERQEQSEEEKEQGKVNERMRKETKYYDILEVSSNLKRQQFYDHTNHPFLHMQYIVLCEYIICKLYTHVFRPQISLYLSRQISWYLFEYHDDPPHPQHISKHCSNSKSKVKPEASEADLKKAYMKLAKKWEQKSILVRGCSHIITSSFATF